MDADIEMNTDTSKNTDIDTGTPVFGSDFVEVGQHFRKFLL